MPGPNLPNLPLEDCCVSVLRQMRGEFERAGLLRDVMAIAPLARGMELRPTAVASGAAHLVISIASGDWDRLRAITARQAFAIARARCQSWATTEWAHHGFGASRLGQFWEAMVASYT
ncbi:MAG: hypothetical protein MUF25_00350 [Pirellulaceae bacterium]|nr:hypothetical protein [Pirellulaceae bacterium]